jgi:ankyrin repeat protein
MASTADTPDLNGSFLEAAAKGSLPVLERLLAEGADVNARSSTGRTALMRLGRRGERNPALVRLLLDRGADVGLAERMGLTALHHAVDRAGPTTVELLLDAGADPNAGDRESRPPLWYAMRRKSVELMTLLIDRGADPNARTHALEDEPLLYWAMMGWCGGGDLDVVRCLLDRGADPNAVWKGTDNPLYIAICTRNLPVIQLLLDRGASVQPSFGGVPSSLPLVTAIHMGLPDLVRELLERGTQPNVPLWHNDVPPLLAAALQDDAASVRMLLEAGADPLFRNAVGDVLLDIVEEEGHSRMVRLLEAALEDS